MRVHSDGEASLDAEFGANPLRGIGGTDYRLLARGFHLVIARKLCRVAVLPVARRARGAAWAMLARIYVSPLQFHIVVTPFGAIGYRYAHSL
ncbi:hypothetical protein GWC77_17575 [Paraburkholderia sp. NMBU_R16]|uniref:hypothetical protein n=1 Tax=Paraburkholderia sp. NMBU_R16 TaxID=2698676 RepID=UPI00156312AA|nr:hypothetical protein [Paraburkholderia sp. NMBU_R16]NRO97734.1 hypothetical protein [Paraburkholderia sp. NMBU_R16]